MKNKIKSDFPIFQQEVNGHPLAFLDSAASAQKPKVIIDVMTTAMTDYYANIHRGLYTFSQQSTAQYENARHKVAEFIGAEDNEIVFTRNATEAINLVAASWGADNLYPDDEILISELEHHANIVPWQMIAQKTGAKIVVAPIDDNGNLTAQSISDNLSSKTKIVALCHMSNAIGTIIPIEEITKTIREKSDAKILLDGCQSVVHEHIHVKDLDCDFFVFSAHKLYGPSGIGILYGKYGILESMPPYQGGGDMIDTVTYQLSTYDLPPARFEAGTPAIIEAIGLGAAIDYINSFDREALLKTEHDIYRFAEDQLNTIEGLTTYHKAENHSTILSFNINGIHASDIGVMLDKEGVAVRVGHHCAMPLMERLGITATVRASFGIYNDEKDVHQFIGALRKIKTLFS